jgi:hypothetical protein
MIQKKNLEAISGFQIPFNHLSFVGYDIADGVYDLKIDLETNAGGPYKYIVYTVSQKSNNLMVQNDGFGNNIIK